MLLSAFAKDPMFGLLAQGHAAANSYWLGLSVAARLGDTLSAGIAAPNGEWLAQAPRDDTPRLWSWWTSMKAPQAPMKPSATGVRGGSACVMGSLMATLLMT